MPLKVESFHINVGAGDGAIHLLTEEPKAGTGGRRSVVQAYLVDGGRRDCKYLIDDVVEWIEQSYWCPCEYSKNSYLMFDGFIITHWDGDHYGGVMEWLEKQVGQTTRHGQTRWGFNRARYAVDWMPKTFCYWPEEQWAKCKFDGWQHVRADGQTDYYIYAEKLVEEGGIMQKEMIFLARLRSKHDDLLGRNIFRHASEFQLNRHPVGRKASMTGLSHLLDNTVNPNTGLPNGNPPLLPDGATHTDAFPAMYCIAADKFLLGNNGAIDITPPNKSSLVFIIVWKSGNGHHVSHYFAGDAHSTMERRVSEWMNPYSPVTSMKLSHHGASSSNPDEIFLRFNPLNILVSAGGQYGHPSEFDHCIPIFC